MGPQTPAFDVIVIGGGMVGCTIAHTLAARRLTVAVLEANAIGRGTSDSSFAWINATSKTNDEGYHRLNALGAAGYRALAREWGEERIGLYPIGMLQWADAADRARIAEMRSRAERLEQFGYPVGWVRRHDLESMEPHVVFSAGAEGLHAHADAWLDVPTYLAFAGERIRALGGTVHEDCRARALTLGENGAVAGVQTDAGELSAPRVVVATGDLTPDVLGEITGHPPFATRFPMRRAPGLLVRTPPLRPFVLARHILYTADPGHLHIRPTADGGLLLGADDTDGIVADDGRDTPRERLREGAGALLARARSFIPGFAGEALADACELKVGVRPMPADGHSIAGPMPGSEGLYLALTHSGVTLSPALGALIADAIERGEVPAELSRFGFDRFQSSA